VAPKEVALELRRPLPDKMMREVSQGGQKDKAPR